MQTGATNNNLAVEYVKPDYPTKDAKSTKKPEGIGKGPDLEVVGHEASAKVPEAKGSQEDLEKETNELLDKAIEIANKRLYENNNEIQRIVHKKTNTVIIKIVNKSTHEVVREFPPEKRLDALAKMWELVGILVDEAR